MNSPKIKLIRDNFYWVENTEAGAFKAHLRLISPNDKSLLFKFPELVGLRVSGGIAVSEWLALLGSDTGYTELHTGQPWTISEDGPGANESTQNDHR